MVNFTQEFLESVYTPQMAKQLTQCFCHMKITPDKVRQGTCVELIKKLVANPPDSEAALLLGLLLLELSKCTTQADIQDQILPAYRTLGLEDPKYIFISHNHGDHAGGLQWAMEVFPKALVTAGSDTLRQKYPERCAATPKDGDRLLECFQVVTVPGHTPDSRNAKKFEYI